MSKTDVRGFFDKKYIGSWDLPEGKDAVLIIDRCERGRIKGMTGEEKKAPIVFFSNVRNRDKPMILNSGNTKIVIRLYGKYVEDWVGKPIAVYVTRTLAFGEETDGIRVRPEAPAMPKAGQTALAAAPEPGEEAAS